MTQPAGSLDVRLRGFGAADLAAVVGGLAHALLILRPAARSRALALIGAGALLLTHSHAMVSPTSELLIEVSRATIGQIGLVPREP